MSRSLLSWRMLIVAVTVIIFYLALSPAPPSAVNFGWDKANHATAMAVITLLGSRAFQSFSRPLFYAAGYALLVSILIELLQGLCTAHRSAEWGDLAADSFGIALAFPLALLFIPEK